VHKATRGEQTFAVKVQYPGVASSISSDLKIVKPIAAAMFKISAAELDQYLGEVEGKLLEETDYLLELRRSMEITELCAGLDNVAFPKYHPDMSSSRILVMDWLEGRHIKEWLATNPTQEARNTIGQALWDFYDYQIHQLRMLHADPHPGNFLITPEQTLGVLDFGCVKEIPDNFYTSYFQLMSPNVLDGTVNLEELFDELGFLIPQDSPKERKFFVSLFTEMIELLGRPFRYDSFDFGDDEYFQQIFDVGERVSKMKEVRNSKSARGNKHGLYINRTYFGLYNLLNELKANIRIHSFASSQA
jgi:predicted unusual protein kinase regulating ubiquinone biosynthesis (AarF/ABC1/UbiB family)